MVIALRMTMPPRKSSRSRKRDRVVVVPWLSVRLRRADARDRDVHGQLPAQPELGLGQRVDHDGPEDATEVVGVVERAAHEGHDGVAAFLVLGAGVVAHRHLERERVEDARLRLGRWR